MIVHYRYSFTYEEISERVTSLVMGIEWQRKAGRLTHRAARPERKFRSARSVEETRMDFHAALQQSIGKIQDVTAGSSKRRFQNQQDFHRQSLGKNQPATWVVRSSRDRHGGVLPQ